jgi:hypothetical protein
MLRSLKKLQDLDKDDLLELVGLESRRSSAEKLVPALALFGTGVLVGVGLGLLLAPKPGRELRSDLKQRLQKGEPNGARREVAPAASTVPAQKS